MTDLSTYRASAGDWRQQIRQNTKRSHYVIAMFVIIYLVIGFAVDCVVSIETHHLTLGLAIQKLLTFQIFPLATLSMAALALISLYVSYKLHDKLILLGTKHHEVTPETATDPSEKQLWDIVEELKVAAGLRYMPKIYIIDADYMNAFASGYSEKSALVAITRGLMQKLDRAELQAVMAHELSHIRHQDIKLTLTASLLSNLIIIAIDIIFRGAIYGDRKSRKGNQILLVILLLRVLLPIITLLLMLYLSRSREYMADAGAVELMRDNEPLARALIKISHDHETHKEAYQKAYTKTQHEEARRAAYIFDPTTLGLDKTRAITGMFSTHPSLEKRLKALGFTKKT